MMGSTRRPRPLRWLIGILFFREAMMNKAAKRVVRSAVAMFAVLLAGSAVRADEFENPKANIPPKAAPQRRNAGEGMPPLPLPATPLRRSEKKREPSPPALVGNITFSQASLKQSGLNWQNTVIDIEKWVDFTNQQLGQRYRFVGTD